MRYFIFIIISFCCPLLAITPEDPGAGIENKVPKRGVCWLNSVSQALRASPNFRAACLKASKKDVVMKRMHQFIQKLDKKKLIEDKKVQKLARFLIKKAKAEGFRISGNPWALTEYFLQKSAISPLPFNRRISVKSNITGFKKADFQPDVKPHMMLFAIKPQTKEQELSHLLLNKQQTTFTGLDVSEMVLNVLLQSKERLGLKTLPKIKPSSKMHYEEEIDLELENEKSAPPLLTVCLKRMGDKKQGLLQFFANEIYPSKALEIPLQADKNKRACYELVSVVATRLMSNISGRFIGHAYTYVLSNDTWIKFNDKKVQPYDKQKETKMPKKSKFTPYEDLSKHGSIYFYELVGFKDL